MPAPLAERLNVAAQSVKRILGRPIQSLPFEAQDVPPHILELMPVILTQQRLEAQAAEIGLICYDANKIEALYREKGVLLPRAYSVFTVGVNPPADALEIGTLGEGTFDGFLPPEAYGHSGKVYEADGVMIISGRAHPTERIGDKWHNMVLAHELRVIKELVRRQRADLGINPPIVLTYVTGAAESTMGSGRIGIVVDDSEFTNIAHPGHGPIGLIEEWSGAHFEPKMGRSGNKNVMTSMVAYANEHSLNLQPVVTNGTPGATEYQSAMEFALLEGAFEKVLSNPAIVDYIQDVFGGDAMSKLALLFNMGVTFELATVRQKFKHEAEPAFIALNLTTDLVGGPQSFVIDHDAVVNEALSHGEENGRFIMAFLRQICQQTEYAQFRDRVDYSIRTRLNLPQ